VALRAWSARRLGAMWIIGLVAELALVSGVGLYRDLTEPPEFRAARLRLDSLKRWGRALDDSIARGLRPPPSELTPAQKESFRALLRDSVGITWETRGNLTTVQLPPALAAGVSRAAEHLPAALWGAFLLSAALALPIPLALLGLTFVWFYIRRRPPPGVAAA
jgi:hypothetical protein